MTHEPHPEWIEKVAKLAGTLGLDAMRVRWKLLRWHERRRQAKRRLEQKLDHVGYEHKTCDECSAVADKDATICTRCGAKLGSRRFQVLRRLGVLSPISASPSVVLAIAMLAIYARMIILQGGGLGSPSGWLLFDLGAQWPLGDDSPWRLASAMFLHIGLWHVAFNLLAIASVGPHVEELYGRTTALFLFLATGILANIGSGWFQPEVLSAGASGGVCGLIGVAAGEGHRAGTSRGRQLRNDMLKWLAATILIGFAIGANNHAHAFGALAGAAFGLAITPATWKRRGLLVVRTILGIVAVAVAIGTVVLVLTRVPADRTATPGYEVSTQVMLEKLCALDAAGHRSAARTVMAAWYSGMGYPVTFDDRMIVAMCAPEPEDDAPVD